MSESAAPPEPTRPAVWPFKNYPSKAATEEAKAIFRKHGQKLPYFKSNINRKFMLEAPFQFDPYWQKRYMR